jgi:hypothetical protein
MNLKSGVQDYFCYTFLLQRHHILPFFNLFDLAVFLLHSYLWVKFSLKGRGRLFPDQEKALPHDRALAIIRSD